MRGARAQRAVRRAGLMRRVAVEQAVLLDEVRVFAVVGQVEDRLVAPVRELHQGGEVADVGDRAPRLRKLRDWQEPVAVAPGDLRRLVVARAAEREGREESEEPEHG